ncbi:hypothetical protein VKT23_013808 [Stygiomarasmius scandens]|uniref:Uncharacterized protein n=1 Tax=Marasmiellus scandens TaxID=2682957 RepID=A0ABR1J6L3_9AGAR
MYPPASYPSPQLLRRYPPTSINGIPDYIDPRLDYASRRMIQNIIQHVSRYEHIELCPKFLRRNEIYHRLTIDPLWIDVDAICPRCSPERRYSRLTEEEREELSELYPEYRARMEGRIDLTRTPTPPPSTPLPPMPSSSLVPPGSPPPPYRPTIRPPSPRADNPAQTSSAGPSRFPRSGHRRHPYISGSGSITDPIDVEISTSAAASRTHVHQRSILRFFGPHRPPFNQQARNLPPYSPPVLETAGFSGSGTNTNPVDLDSVADQGTSADPFDLTEG